MHLTFLLFIFQCLASVAFATPPPAGDTWGRATGRHAPLLTPQATEQPTWPPIEKVPNLRVRMYGHHDVIELDIEYTGHGSSKIGVSLYRVTNPEGYSGRAVFAVEKKYVKVFHSEYIRYLGATIMGSGELGDAQYHVSNMNYDERTQKFCVADGYTEPGSRGWCPHHYVTRLFDHMRSLVKH